MTFDFDFDYDFDFPRAEISCFSCLGYEREEFHADHGLNSHLEDVTVGSLATPADYPWA